MIFLSRYNNNLIIYKIIIKINIYGIIYYKIFYFDKKHIELKLLNYLLVL